MNRSTKVGHLTHKFNLAIMIIGLLMGSGNLALGGGTSDPVNHDWETEIVDTFGEENVDVEKGSMRFAVEADCEDLIEKYDNCFGNNPASPYGLYEFSDFSGPADSFRFRLAENQAVMFIGRTPPTGRYFSFQLYPFSRHRDFLRDPPMDPAGEFCDEFGTMGCLEPRQVLAGIMGLNINHQELKTDGPDDDPFDRFTIVVTTANQEIEQHILNLLPDALVDLGLPSDIINIDEVPCPQVGNDGKCDDEDDRNLVLGSEPESDDFMMALRVAITESLASQEEYLNNPPATVLRVTFNEFDNNFSGYRWDEPPEDPSATLYNETEYQEAMRWLAENVQDTFAPGGKIKSFNRGGGKDYYHCLQDEKKCNAGSEDAYYSKGPNIAATCAQDGLSLYVIGVNHSQAGPYSYSSLSIRDPDQRHELGFFADTNYTVLNYPDQDPPMDPDLVPPPYLGGSVEYFLPSDQFPRPTGLENLIEDLYIAEVTLDCDPVDNPHCIEVAIEDLSEGMLGLQERTYLNTEANTGGWSGNFILSRVVVPNAGGCGVFGPMVPGDCNQDGDINIADAQCLLGFLFLDNPSTLPCGNRTETDPGNIALLSWNGDSQVNIADAVGCLGLNASPKRSAYHDFQKINPVWRFRNLAL